MVGTAFSCRLFFNTSKYMEPECPPALPTVICFDKDGEFDSEKTNAVCEAKFANIERAVVPGFYGAMPNGKVKTFSRGGSDVTGSIVARALKADMYLSLIHI